MSDHNKAARSSGEGAEEAEREHEKLRREERWAPDNGGQQVLEANGGAAEGERLVLEGLRRVNIWY